MPQYPISILRTAPDTLTVESYHLTLTSFLIRDFMPITPPGGEPLYAGVILQDIDSLTISDDFELNYLWVINGTEVWDTYFTDEEFPSQPPYRIERIARDGPQWDPGTMVDVVVEISGPGGDTYLIQVRDQVIVAVF